MTQPTSLTLRACAKVNFTLDVFSKRPDGYHGVASVMQTISLHDLITVTRTAQPGIAFTCSGPLSEGIPVDTTNLVYRAAAGVLEAAGQTGVGLAIHLDKRTPSQAGLGGGSSDAAATLVGVNALLDAGLPHQTLSTLAAALGSDVPFFLMGGTAVARGRGEQLTTIKDAPALWLVVVKPPVNVSTGWAYGQLDADPERVSHRGTRRMEQAIEEANRDLVISRMCNDFEAPVLGKHPELAWLSDELMMAGGQTVRLCGSGSAMFAVAADQGQATRIAGLVSTRHPGTHICRTLTGAEAHPLSEVSL